MVSILFLVGLVVGSFLNVVILRGSLLKSLGGRSHCRSCKRNLTPRELIPVISFLIQKRRCRACNTVLLWQYPLVELGTATLYGIAGWYILSHNMVWWQSFFYLSISFVGIAAAIYIFVSDLKFYIVPNGAAALLFLIGIMASVARSWHNGLIWEVLGRDIGSSIILCLVLASLWFFSHGRWMGFGDAKLILATSLILGFPLSIVAFLFSFWLGALAGITLILLHLKKVGEHIPFGPFILAGSLLAYFFAKNFLFLGGFQYFLVKWS